MDLIKDVVSNASSYQRLEGVEGKSGNKLLGTLVGLVAKMPRHACYLEVGTYRGLSLINVAKNNPDKASFGIDNFSQFNSDGSNKNAVYAAMALYDVSATLIDKDFEEALLNFDRKVGVYFVDGPHDYRSQYLCLDFGRRSMITGGVIVIDDANYEHVRRANNDWLRANQDWTLLYEHYTYKHPVNMTKEHYEDAVRGWWNGVNILIHDPDKSLPRNLPPVSHDRDRYFNDHLIHASRYAELMGSIAELIGRSDMVTLNKVFQGKLQFDHQRFQDRSATLSMHFEKSGL